MDKADISFWLSIAGFIISAILAAVRLMEFFVTRRVSFKLSSSLVSLEEIGNTITVLNRSSIPVTISYYEIGWVKKRELLGIPIPYTKNETSSETPLEPGEGCNILVQPHQTEVFVFKNDSHFYWGSSIKHDIYLKIWLVGYGGPYWLWITGPSKYR